MDASKVQQLATVKEEIKNLNEQLKVLERERDALSLTILEGLETDGMTLARTKFGTVSIQEAVVPNTKDWAELEEYVYNNRALHLFQRRLSAPAYRDELAVNPNGKIPGVEPYVKKTLSLRNS